MHGGKRCETDSVNTKYLMRFSVDQASFVTENNYKWSVTAHHLAKGRLGASYDYILIRLVYWRINDMEINFPPLPK